MESRQEADESIHQRAEHMHHSLCHYVVTNMSSYSNDLLWKDKEKFILRDVADTDPEDIQLLKHSLIIFNKLSPLLRKTNAAYTGGLYDKVTNVGSLSADLKTIIEHSMAIYNILNQPHSESMEALNTWKQKLDDFKNNNISLSQLAGLLGDTQQVENLHQMISQQITSYFRPESLIDPALTYKTSAPVTIDQQDAAASAQQTKKTIDDSLQQMRASLSWLEENGMTIHLKNAPMNKKGHYIIKKDDSDTALDKTTKGVYNLLANISVLYDPQFNMASPNAISTYLKIFNAYSSINWEETAVEVQKELHQVYLDLLNYVREQYLPLLKDNAAFIHQFEIDHHLKPGVLLTQANALFSYVEKFYVDQGIYVPSPFINEHYLDTMEKKVVQHAEAKKRIDEASETADYIINILDATLNYKDLPSDIKPYREKMLLALTHFSDAFGKENNISAEHIHVAQQFFMNQLTLQEKQDLLANLEKNTDPQKIGIKSEFNYDELKKQLQSSVDQHIAYNNRWWFTKAAANIGDVFNSIIFPDESTLFTLLETTKRIKKEKLLPQARAYAEEEERVNLLKNELTTQRIQSAFNLLDNRNLVGLLNAVKAAENDSALNVAEQNRLAVIIANALFNSQKDTEKFLQNAHKEVKEYLPQLETVISNLFEKSNKGSDKMLCRTLATQLLMAGFVDPQSMGSHFKVVLSYNDPELESQTLGHIATDALTKIEMNHLLDLITKAESKDEKSIRHLAVFNLAIKQVPINEHSLAAEINTLSRKVNRDNLLDNLRILHNKSDAQMQNQIGFFMGRLALNDKSISDKNFAKIIFAKESLAKIVEKECLPHNNYLYYEARLNALPPFDSEKNVSFHDLLNNHKELIMMMHQAIYPDDKNTDMVRPLYR